MLERYTSVAIAGLAKQTVRKPDFQRGLLESARKPDEFIGFVESAMRSVSGGEIVDGDQQMKLPEFPFCEREVCQLAAGHNVRHGRALAPTWKSAMPVNRGYGLASICAWWSPAR